MAWRHGRIQWNTFEISAESNPDTIVMWVFQARSSLCPCWRFIKIICDGVRPLTALATFSTRGQPFLKARAYQI